MRTSQRTDPEVARFWELWADELAGAALYRALAERAGENRREILMELADAEERHAAHWAKLMAERGMTEPRRRRRDPAPGAPPRSGRRRQVRGHRRSAGLHGATGTFARQDRVGTRRRPGRRPDRPRRGTPSRRRGGSVAGGRVRVQRRARVE